MTLDSHSMTILIVDDDPGHVELVRRNLRRAGVNNEILAIPNGRDALDYILGLDAASANGEPTLANARTDLLILLDINMPGGLDGLEVLRRLKAGPETQKLPVIMLTTTDDPREIDRCYALGCNIYITKPVDPSAFIEAVHRLGLFISIVSMPCEGASGFDV